MKNVTFIPIVAGLIACTAGAAFGAATVSISSSGKGVFTVKGSDFSAVAGAKITVAYDAATLGNPRVVQGGLVSDALMASNTSTPGTVTLALIHGGTKGVSGSGELATITFDLRGSSPGVIQSQSVDLVNTGGNRIAVASQIYNPAASTGDTPATVTTTSSGSGEQVVTPPGGTQKQDPSANTAGSPVNTAGSPANTGRVLGGGLIAPDEAAAAKAEEKPQEQRPAEVVAPRKEATATAATGGEDSAQREVVAKVADDGTLKVASIAAAPPAAGNPAVLDRFRSYQGAKTPASMAALFNAPAGKGFRQEPAILIADGATKATLYVEVASPGKTAPSFAMENANLLTVKRAGASGWVVEALPPKGASTATLIMLQDGAMIEMPLTVAPPLPKDLKLGKGGTFTEADFNRFLAERGTSKAPSFDLNRDGVRDYLDDYIFTANYIVAAERGQKVQTKEPK